MEATLNVHSNKIIEIEKSTMKPMGLLKQFLSDNMIAVMSYKVHVERT